MSPRAAWRLESRGFEQVYDYVAGKADWGSFGLPSEGRSGSESRAGAHVRLDVPTCRLDERLPEIRERIRGTGWETCLVVNEERIVLGRLGRSALRGDDDVSAETAMTAGPSTVRPGIGLEAIAQRMRKQKLTSVVVTRSDGRLVGVLLREDAEQALAGSS